MIGYMRNFLIDLRLVWRVWYHRVFSRPRIFLVWLAIFIVIITILQWLFSLETLQVILTGDNGLSFIDKIDVLLDAFLKVFTQANDIVPISFILIAAFQATSIMYLRVLKKKRRFTAGASKPLLFALFGSGCIACGGSLFTPLLSLLASGVSTSLAERLGDGMLVIGVLLSYRVLSQMTYAYANIVLGEELAS